MNRDKETTRPPVVPEHRVIQKPADEPSIDRTSQNRIGDHLRAMYDGLMQQPVPDRFAELLDRLEARTDDGNRPRR